MAKISTSMQCVLAIALIAITSGAEPGSTAMSTICKVKVAELAECLPAISGKSPPPPTDKCCDVMHRADLTCLCSYKSQLREIGANPKAAMALPEKCGLETPKKCKSLLH